MKKERTPLQTSRPRTQTQPFPPRRDYASLSVKDLIDAREHYHVHLSSLENVIGTAIGRYLIHEDDWYAKNAPDHSRPNNVGKITEPRTLANSVIRPWSWPAVLVFVRRWESNESLGSNAVPRMLYLPDGRVVPTCVVLAPPDESQNLSPRRSNRASELLGGGYPCVRDHQGEQSSGTVACLVKKAGSYYALTNRHVAGGDGEEVRAFVRGNPVSVGKTSNIAVDRLLMSSAFPEWNTARTYLTLDAGLIYLNDITDWTSQAFGIGEIGEVFDATAQSVTLDLIGCPLRAFGGGTGLAEGEIRALFFRFQSLGGFDYATDLLIGPRRTGHKTSTDLPFTNPGDSGTLWFYDPPTKTDDQQSDEGMANKPVIDRGRRARRLRPIAMQWGGQRSLLPDGSTTAFALGSFLSTICRSLDVEVVRNWSTGHEEYWGKIGHFAIGWKACDEVSGTTLRKLMKLNQPRIGFGNEKLAEGDAFRMGRDGFVPLADVPDYVWVNSRPSEPVQHFADIDIYDIKGGASILQRCFDDPANISAGIWKEYFDGFAAKGVGPEEGCLPFRVWQLWEAMVDFLKAKDPMGFVAAAGVLAHYVGDASQPLHCSFMHHGMPPMLKVDGRKYPVRRSTEEFSEFKESAEAKIHALYEEKMLEIDPTAALEAVDAELAQRGQANIQIRSGHDAARATIVLMYNAQKRLSPQKIIDADDSGLKPKARAEALWENNSVRKATITSLAESVQVLAALWASAWRAGNGDSLPKSSLVAFDEEDLQKLYRSHNFAPSLSLDAMAKSGKFEP